MGQVVQGQLRKLPSVDSVLQDLKKHQHSQQLSPTILTAICRAIIDEYREKILAETTPTEADLSEQIAADVRRQVESLMKPYFRKVVNGMGIVLHTGLGRAVLAPDAMAQ